MVEDLGHTEILLPRLKHVAAEPPLTCRTASHTTRPAMHSPPEGAARSPKVVVVVVVVVVPIVVVLSSSSSSAEVELAK